MTPHRSPCITQWVECATQNNVSLLIMTTKYDTAINCYPLEDPKKPDDPSFRNALNREVVEHLQAEHDRHCWGRGEDHLAARWAMVPDDGSRLRQHDGNGRGVVIYLPIYTAAFRLSSSSAYPH